VTVIDTAIRVSTWSEEATIPLQDVVRVEPRHLWRLFLTVEVIQIELRRTAPFGRSIQFIAPARLRMGDDPHPVVAELEALVERADSSC
jgi:hypothetical protein